MDVVVIVLCVLRCTYAVDPDFLRLFNPRTLLQCTPSPQFALPFMLNISLRSSYDKEDEVVTWFWEHLSECSHEERKVIWNWTTGMKEMPSETSRM